MPSFQFEYPFSRWLYKIASNRCIDHLRRKRFQMLSIDQPISTRDGNELTMDPPDKGPRADDILLAKERAVMLRDALATLPEKYQTVIRMRHEEELAARAKGLLITDTEFITSTVWCEDVFGYCPKWISDKWAIRRI